MLYNAKKEKYIDRGNIELDPRIDPSDRILYEFHDDQ